MQKSVATKTEESKSFLEKARELKLQNTHLKQKTKDMEREHVAITKKINEHDKSVGSPDQVFGGRKEKVCRRLKTIDAISRQKIDIRVGIVPVL